MLRRRITPLSAAVLGAPLADNHRETALQLLQWVGGGLGIPLRWGKGLTDPHAIVAEGYLEQKSVPGVRRLSNGFLYCHLEPAWRQPDEAEVTLQFEAWTKAAQVTVRVNVTIRQDLPLSVLDVPAEHLSALTERIHDRLGGTLSVVDSMPTRSLVPYDVSSLPLWVGWHSVLGPVLVERYKLDAGPAAPGNLLHTRHGRSLVAKSPLPFSEYLARGWDARTQEFWEAFGATLVHKSFFIGADYP